MNIVCTGDGRFIEVQGTAEREPFSRAQMDELVALGVGGIQTLIENSKEVISQVRIGRTDLSDLVKQRPHLTMGILT